MPSFLLRKIIFVSLCSLPLVTFSQADFSVFPIFSLSTFHSRLRFKNLMVNASFFRKLPDCSLSRNYCTTVRGHRKGKVDFMIKKYTVSHKKVVDRTFKDVLGGKIVWLTSTTFLFCNFGLFWPFWPFWPFWVFWPFDLFGSFGLLILLAFLFCFVCFFACLVFLFLLIFFSYCSSLLSLWPPFNLLAFQ